MRKPNEVAAIAIDPANLTKQDIAEIHQFTIGRLFGFSEALQHARVGKAKKLNAYDGYVMMVLKTYRHELFHIYHDEFAERAASIREAI